MKRQLTDLVGILETCGSNPENWPPATRADMEAYIASSAEARQALAEAVELDLYLDSLREPAPAPDLAEQILADLPARPARRARTTRRRTILALPLAAAAALVLWLGRPGTDPASDLASLTNPDATTSLVIEVDSFDWEMPSDVLLHVASLDPVSEGLEFDCFYDEQGCFDSTERRESSLMPTSRNLT